MQELAWRFEFNGVGPFASAVTGQTLHDRMIDNGIITEYEDTFLNLYTQRANPPAMRKEFKKFFNRDWEIMDKDFKFGFRSKEILLDSFGVMPDGYYTHWESQIIRTLDSIPGSELVVYLVSPLASDNTEIIFPKTSEQEILRTSCYKEFLSF